MERIILPYGGLPAGVPQRADASAPSVPSPHAQGPAYIPIGPAAGPMPGGGGSGSGKGASDYVRALRRRFWLLLLVCGVMATVGTSLVLRIKPTYRASARIEIVPPQFDKLLAGLMTDDAINLTTLTMEQDEANRLARLRNRPLVESVLRSPLLGPPVKSEDDPAEALVQNLKTSRLSQSTHYDIHLEGDDPHRVETILKLWLEAFEMDSQNEIDTRIANTQAQAQSSLKLMIRELEDLDMQIGRAMRDTPDLSPDGENYLVRRLESLHLYKLQKRNSVDQLEHQLRISKMFPREQAQVASAADREIARLMDDRELIDDQIQENRRLVRNLRDPAILRLIEKRKRIDQDIFAVQEQSMAAQAPESDPTDTMFAQYRASLMGELQQIKDEERDVLGDIQDMASAHNQFNTLLRERAQTSDGIARLREKVAAFEMIAKTQNKPVQVVQASAASKRPIRPSYTLLVALVCLVSFGSGIGIVVLLEHLDHSVRAPEQLTTGLTLPLLGVVSRMKRTARLQRGGHLWTAGVPHSAEADAYRNLRASLVGLTGPTGQPAVTLLVTSAKAGEGKSTTALNLAATCARSGERTLLLEVDLRRPSLRPVFDEGEHDLGLVDVLRGEMPWQRTVVPTDIPNLDFLPAGDPSGVPVEVLGALEMKQLIAAVSGHYDRVILDGPAILGLADCRMLGRLVDAAILVVRAGANDLRPVLRARSMLEQSQAPIVGVVFNGLCEDMNNWSSVSSYLDEDGEPLAAPAIGGRSRRSAAALAAAE